MIRCGFLLMLAFSATIGMSTSRAETQTFDGITIIELREDDRRNAAATGDYLVTFVSGRGSYAAIVPPKGMHGGCQSLATAGSYTGASITFGIEADVVIREHGLQTYCSTFTLHFDDAETVRILVPGGQPGIRQKVVAHVPLRAVDFESAAFARHDLKGVRLGPILDGEGLGALSAAGGSEDRHKYLSRQVPGSKDSYGSTVQGYAAAAEVTNWPWDVLYFTQHTEELEQTSTFDAFEDAVLDRYGEPSSVYENSGYMLWLYDLDGQKLTMDEPESNDCKATVEFWLKQDPLKRVHGLNWEFNSRDIGPWGCSVMMELNANSGDGGVSGYNIRAGSGYVMAVNHFLQRIEATAALLEKVQALQSRKPQL